MLSYTSQDGTVLLFPKISDTALVNVTPATFFDKLMESNPSAYRSLTRPVVTCIYILMGISRRLTESVQSNVRLQAQDMVKRWEASGEWKTLGSIMKIEPHPAKMPASNIDLKSPTFQYDDWTFTLPQMDEMFFDQGVLDTVCFSRAFAKQNGQHVVAKSVIFAAVGHFVVHYFPDTAAELFINFSDQVHSPNRRTSLENRVKRSGIRKTNLSNKHISAPTTMTTMTLSDSKSNDQTKASAMSKGGSSNAPSKAHVSQRLELQGRVIQDLAPPSPKLIQPQLSNNEVANQPIKPNPGTALETKYHPEQSVPQLTETNGVRAPWNLPAVHPATLTGVTISQFVADFVKLNGEKRSCAATGQEIVTAFNDYIDTHFPQSSYQDKVNALRRKNREVLPTSFHPNFRALEKNRHIMGGGRCGELPSGSTVPFMSKDAGESSHSTDQLATHSVRRRRKWSAIKKGSALDPATPAIIMSSGDMTLGIESQECYAANTASGEPESHPHMHEGQEAKGRESSNESGAKVASLQKRRPRFKSEITSSLNDLITHGTDAYDNAMRKSQKTTHDQNPSVSVARNGVEDAVKRPRAGDLIKADTFLSEVGEELDAKAARKIRFSSHS